MSHLIKIYAVCKFSYFRHWYEVKELISHYDIAWMEHFLNFAEASVAVCFFGAYPQVLSSAFQVKC